MWWDVWKKRSRPSGELTMESPARSETCRVNPHPNDVDRKRIERALRHRARYRYVAPQVHGTEGGYRIESPCCSRRIDSDGGVIDIALLEFIVERSGWRLFRKDHRLEAWVVWSEFATLTQALELLKQDPERDFWP